MMGENTFNGDLAGLKSRHEKEVSRDDECLRLVQNMAQVARRDEAQRALTMYTVARRELDDYRKAYSLVVETLAGLEAALSAQENRLKGAVRMLDEPVENEQFVATIQRRYSRTIDGARLVELAPWLYHVPGALVTTVNEPVIKNLVKAGTLAQEVVDEVTEVKPLTPAVSIKAKA